MIRLQQARDTTSAGRIVSPAAEPGGRVCVGDLLQAHEIDSIDARALLKHVLTVTDAWLAAHPERELTTGEAAAYRALLARRQTGAPVAYLTGEREFYGLELYVTPAVLVPRPETELLVELAFERMAGWPAPRVLDLGTGSGCVAIALAVGRASAVVTATDLAPEALSVARRNARRHGADVEFLQSDWFESLTGRRFDIIVANPPYLAAGDPHLASGALPHEPRHALVAGPRGDECIDHVVQHAARYLTPGGWLLFEHGCAQGSCSADSLIRRGYDGVFTARDLAGLERVSGGRV